MRFALKKFGHSVFHSAFRCVVIGCTSVFLSLPLLSSAQVGAVYELDMSAQNTRLSASSKRLQKQARGQGTLNAIEGLVVSEEMTGLGTISDIVLSRDGTLFVSDRKRGRLWSISDRGLDGEFDGRRPVCGNFDTPSGLAVDGNDIVYIADQNAIWTCNAQSGKRREYVSLRAAQSGHNMPRPLSISPVDGALIIGLNAIKSVSETVSKLIRIDPKDKKAEVLATYNAPINAIAIRPQGDIWLTVGNVFINSQSNRGQRLEGFARIDAADQHVLNGLILPGQFDVPKDWPIALRDHVILAQSGLYALPQGTSGGMNIVAMPTEFGAPIAKIQVLVDGFLSSRGGGAWGRPGPMVMDSRGLYFGDSWQGSLWRISTAPIGQALTTQTKRSVSVSPNLDSARLAADLSQTPPSLVGDPVIGSTVSGSSIGHGSGIGQGSSIKNGSSILRGSAIEAGSYLVRDYDAQKAREAQAKKEAEKAEPDKTESEKTESE